MLFNSTTILFLAFLLAPGKKSNDKPRECIKAEASFCQKKVSLVKAMVFPVVKVSLVKAMVFPVVMYRCESCTIKKAEHWRTDAFKLWCWRSLESPLDSKENKPVNPKGNQPWIFFGRTDAEAEAPMLWPPDVKSWLLRKDLMLGKIEGGRRRGRQSRLDGINSAMDMSLSRLWEWSWTGKPGML